MELRWPDGHRMAAFKYVKGCGVEEDLTSSVRCLEGGRPLSDGPSRARMVRWAEHFQNTFKNK